MLGLSLDGLNNNGEDLRMKSGVILILVQLNPVTVSPRREKIPYICDLGARFGCERVSEHSNRRE